MLEIIVLMYNLVPYSRSALFLRRPQPDPLLETRPRWSGDAARAGCSSWGGGHSRGTAGGIRSGTGLVPHCTLDFCSPRTNSGSKDAASTSQCPAGRSPCAGLDPLPFGATKAVPRPCQVKDADLPRSLAVSKAKYCREGARGGKQDQQDMLGLCNGWQLPGGREALPRRRRSRRQRSEVPDSPGGAYVALQSSIGECVVPLKTSHATQLWLGKGKCPPALPLGLI